MNKPAELPVLELRPQAGPQEAYLSSEADIVIYGGGAGSGKTYGSLLEPLRYITSVPGFGAVIFRREATQITNEGGLWDEAMKMYPYCGGVPKLSSPMAFVFTLPSGHQNKVGFNHLNQEADVLNWQGAQIPLIIWDELTHFTRFQFFYMLSRNRSTCGVRPYMRATCNPDPDSWVKELIQWWIDPETGYPIKERSGVVRYFARINDVIEWGDDPQELADRTGCALDDCKSLTFIAAKITDNPALMRKDPGYMANLKALPRVERERLLGGNWNVKPASGAYFSRHDVRIVPNKIPHFTEIAGICRGWDLAATKPSEENPNPDWTVGVKMLRKVDGRYLVVDMARFREKAGEVRKRIKLIASYDCSSVSIQHYGQPTIIRIPQDPGQAGVDQVDSFITTTLAGFPVVAVRPSGDKELRATPFAAAWQHGLVDVMEGPWNEAFFQELESFPDPTCHDDIVDACADAYNQLALGSVAGVAEAVGETESSNADW